MDKKGLKTFIAIAGRILLIPLITSYTPAAPPASPGSAPQRGAILKISARGEASTLNSMMNPSVAVIPYMAPVFNGLFMIDPMQEEFSVEKVVPALAEKWTVSPDGEICTFYLRKGIKSHDGHPFTAKDIKYSLDFFADPTKSASKSSSFMASCLGDDSLSRRVEFIRYKVVFPWP